MKSHELQVPGVCFICEMTQEGLEYFDTGRNFESRYVTHLAGRKYICELCFNEAAEVWEYEASNTREESETAITRAKAELKDLYTTMDINKDAIMSTWREVESLQEKRGRGRPRIHVPIEVE